MASVNNKPASEWTSAEVAQWVTSLSDMEPEDGEVFKKERINGKTLLKLKKEDIKGLGFPVGVVLSLEEEITKLQISSESGKTEAPTQVAAADGGAKLGAPFKKLHNISRVTDEYFGRYTFFNGLRIPDDPDLKEMYIFHSRGSASNELDICTRGEKKASVIRTIKVETKEGTSYNHMDTAIGNKLAAWLMSEGQFLHYYSKETTKQVEKFHVYQHSSAGAMYRIAFLSDEQVIMHVNEVIRGGYGLMIRDTESNKPITFAKKADCYWNSSNNMKTLITNTFFPHMVYFGKRDGVEAIDTRVGLEKPVQSWQVDKGVPVIGCGYQSGPAPSILMLNSWDGTQVIDPRKAEPLHRIPQQFSAPVGLVTKNAVFSGQNARYVFDLTGDMSVPVYDLGRGSSDAIAADNNNLWVERDMYKLE